MESTAKSFVSFCLTQWTLYRPRTHGNVFLRFCIVTFQVMSCRLFSIPLRTVNNIKTQENVSVCTAPEFTSEFNKVNTLVNRRANFQYYSKS